MNKHEKEQLADIHKLALSEDHFEVPFSKDQLKMTNKVIANMQDKLLRIADLIQDVCRD